MRQERDLRMNEPELARLALFMEGVVPGYERTETGMRQLAAELGFAPDSTVPWPRRADGMLQGVVCTALVDGEARPWTVHQDHRGVVVPLSRITADAPGHAAEYCRTAVALQRVLGSPDYFGTYANDDAGRSWGTPHMRWREKYATVELRAGASGPELVSDFTDLWEEDYREAMQRNPTGFIGANGGDALLHVPAATARDLGEFTESLAALLSCLPAETTALGVTLGLGLFGRVRQGFSPLLFDIRSGGHLHVGYFAPDGVAAAASGEAAAQLGWRPTRPAAFRDSARPAHFDAPWHFDGGAPGATRAREAADLIVRTAVAAGVESVEDLALGGEAEQQGHHYFRYPGLRLKTV
ncbi:hypothetical protein [Glycomyces tritici]|uniref:Uncharacterized protein n=1 Tax=Glycomyces tritici TaxID=2665176 RepID=A0ABT7YPQ8_9ACTN|nr:hypothetical protein [Glycomyces tritici]MDN3240394.1 hypothetical protein [Glycomyces tritici]